MGEKFYIFKNGVLSRKDNNIRMTTKEGDIKDIKSEVVDEIFLFGEIDINESSFIKYGDGFIVTTRGYDGQQWIFHTDNNFKLVKQVNLTENYNRNLYTKSRVCDTINTRQS